MRWDTIGYECTRFEDGMVMLFKMRVLVLKTSDKSDYYMKIMQEDIVSTTWYKATYRGCFIVAKLCTS